MRILFHLAGDVVGGAETQLKHLVEHLKDRHKILVTYDQLEMFAKSMEVETAKIYSPNVAARVIQKFNPEIIQFYHNAAFYKGVKKSFTSAKVVEVAHNAHAFSFDCTTYPKDRTHLVVCVSESARDNFLSSGIDIPTKVIPNGIDPRRFFPPSHKTTNPRPLGGFCGRLEGGSGKGIDTLLQIVGSIPEIDFELVGVDQGSWAKLVPPNVKVLPYTNDMTKYYHRWDFFMSRSPREGFGLAIAEALACGLPSVIYDCGGITELLEHEKHAFIAKNDQEMETYLWRILEQDHDLKPTTIDFSASKMAQLYEETYEGLFEKPVVAPPPRLVRPSRQIECLTTCPESWAGVRKALQQYSNEFVDIQKAPISIQNLRPKRVVLGGYHPQWKGVLETAKRTLSRVTCTWHNTPVLNEFDRANRTCFLEAIRAYHMGLISDFETPHMGMYATLEAYGIKAEFAPNKVTEITVKPKKREGIHIGIFGTGLPWKNMDTQILAAGMVKGATVHLQNVPDVSLLSTLGIKYEIHPYFSSRDAFYSLLGSMSVNLAVSLTETFGFLVAESFLLGVPAITNWSAPVLALAGDVPFCRAQFPDDPYQIASLIDRVLKDRDSIARLGAEVIRKRWV